MEAERRDHRSESETLTPGIMPLSIMLTPALSVWGRKAKGKP